MMMKKLLPYILLILLGATGCELDPPVYPGVIDITATDLTTYLPTDKKATWEYDVERQSGTTLENHTLSGETVDIDNAPFYTVTIDPATTEEIRYYSKTDGLYSMRANAPSNGESITLQYLKDGALLGDSWNADLNEDKKFDGSPARTQTIIRETDITRIVSGKRYTHVIHTQVEIQHNIGDGMRTFAVYHFYIAKGVGIIELSIDFENETLATYLLKNYRVK